MQMRIPSTPPAVKLLVYGEQMYDFVLLKNLITMRYASNKEGMEE